METTLNSVSNRSQETLQEIRDFLDIDRVALFQFFDDGSGEIVAESLSEREVLGSLMNLRFPASDIPQGTRTKFLEEEARYFIDVELRQELQGFRDRQQKPIYLCPSPCHTKFLEQLNVKVSFTYPIIVRETLWGLLLIHHSERYPLQQSDLEMLELLSERVNLLVITEQLAQFQEGLFHREATIKAVRDLVSCEKEGLPIKKILEITVEAMGGCGGRIYLQGLWGKREVYKTGKQPLGEILGSPEQDSEVIFEESVPWQNLLLEGEQISSGDFSDFVSVQNLPGESSLGYGMLVIPLVSPSHRQGYLTVFCHRQTEEVWWAGRPPRNQEERGKVRPSFHPWREVREASAKENWTMEAIKLGGAIAQLLKDGFHCEGLSTTVSFQENYHGITHLPNRSLFMNELNLITETERKNQTIAAVVFLDLDRFQQVNKTLGHAAGDQLLRLVGGRLQDHLSSRDSFLAHWQGDEFVILLRNLSDLDSEELATAIADVQHCFSAPFAVFGQEVYVKASWGVAISPYDGSDGETLLLNAETAMYSAKEQGRNRYQVYTASLRSPLNPLNLEAEIRHSLHQEDFCLYYQPQMNLKTGKIAAVEALIRWQHPERGLLSPGHFIPFAEESDLICEIGDWVLRAACEQLAQWQKQGMNHLRVAVNVSGRQFQQRNFVNKVQQILKETNVSGTGLEIEITETTAAHNVDLTRWTLKQLQKIGVSVALDDFGMGYSSLNAIKHFPLNTIKIDRNFIKDINGNDVDSAIVNSVMTLAKGLTLRVVAEGVETFQQLESLRQMSSESDQELAEQEVQGYFISEPLPAQKITEFLVNSHQEAEFFPEKEQPTPGANNEERKGFSAGNSQLERLFNQTRREQLVAKITQQIHASLDLEEIFQVTAAEIRDFLQTDRVVLYRFDENWDGQVVIESVAENYKPLFNREIDDPCFQLKCAPLYAKGRVAMIEDVETAEITPCYREMLESFQVRANLVIPILNQNRLWGLLIAHHCRSSRYWEATEVSLLQQLATQVGVAIYQAELYQQLQQANQTLEELAIKDGLTKVANRRYFDETLDRQWQNLRREQQPLALILCDVDEFKPYNDCYGHQAGDTCLKQVAQALQGVVHRPDDLVARYGGEEFAVILPKTSAEQAMVVAERARQAVADLKIPHAHSSVTSYVTLSLGVGALIPSADNSRKELIRRADQALYAAKGYGRDRVINFLHHK